MNEKVVKLVTRPELLTTPHVLEFLKRCVERIESGELKPEQAIVLLMAPSADDPKSVDYLTLESGLTVEQMLWMLARAQHFLLHRGTEFE